MRTRVKFWLWCGQKLADLGLLDTMRGRRAVGAGGEFEDGWAFI